MMGILEVLPIPLYETACRICLVDIVIRRSMWKRMWLGDFIIDE